MKILKIKVIWAVVFMTAAVSNVTAQIQKAEIIATGLTCSMCSNAINKQLKSLSQVDSVNTDLNTNTFTVYFKKDSNVKPNLLKDSVEKAGFFVGSMIVTLPLEKVNTGDIEPKKAGDMTLVFVDSKPRTINGLTKLKVMDKGFVTQKEYKKLVKSYSKHPTYGVNNEDDYHVKAL